MWRIACVCVSEYWALNVVFHYSKGEGFGRGLKIGGWLEWVILCVCECVCVRACVWALNVVFHDLGGEGVGRGLKIGGWLEWVILCVCECVCVCVRVRVHVRECGWGTKCSISWFRRRGCWNRIKDRRVRREVGCVRVCVRDSVCGVKCSIS